MKSDYLTDEQRTRLIEEKLNPITKATRAEFGISNTHLRLVKLIEVIAKGAAISALAAALYAVYNLYEINGALIFIGTMIGPMWICMAIFHSVTWILEAALVSRYRDYISTESQRHKEATESYTREIRQTTEFWLGLDGYSFEREFANLLRSRGFSAYVTQGTGDGGVDIIAHLNESKIAIQCKRHAKAVGPAVIRELYGVVMAGHYDLGILAVTGGVTRGVIDFVADKPLHIIGLPEIVEMQVGLNKT